MRYFTLFFFLWYTSLASAQSIAEPSLISVWTTSTGEVVHTSVDVEQLRASIQMLGINPSSLPFELLIELLPE